MDRDEIKKRTWVCSCGDQDAVLAEFDRLTEENVRLKADLKECCKESREIERESGLKGIELREAAEALDRICEPVKPDEQGSFDVSDEVMEEVGQRICDYLDSQQKPSEPTDYQPGTVGTAIECKPKDEEVLRGILEDNMMVGEPHNDYEGKEYAKLFDLILKHFQLRKEGE